MYSFTLRICTASLGVLMIGFAYLYGTNGSDSADGLILSFVVGLIGIYLVIAAIVPHRKVTDGIGEEVLWRLVIELPLRLIGRLISKIFDLF